MSDTVPIESSHLNSVTHEARRGVKIGGSLLDLPDLALRILDWLEMQTPMQTVWVVGGGSEVEALREIALQHSADQEAMHWAAIGVMARNTVLIRRMFPATFMSSSEIGQLDDFFSDRDQANTFFDCTNWLHTNSSLPRTWEVTSDSIAMSLAGELRACEVVLFKSVTVSRHDSISDLIHQRIVDEFAGVAFETARTRLSENGVDLQMNLVNLRATN